LNNLQWITGLLNMGGRQSFLNMFSKRRNNRQGVIWASVIGLVVSAAALLLRRNQDTNGFNPIDSLVSQVGQNNLTKNNAVLAEFSKELAPTSKLGKNK
jgi:hypothetical protein